MPPKVKFQKKEIIHAAMEVARKKGIDAVTAREVARELRVSVGPIFTWFETMEQLKAEIHELAKECYRDYIKRGLAEPVPFLGVWRHFLVFVREEPELYRLLFLKRSGSVSGSAVDAMRFTLDLVRPSIMKVYDMDEDTAEKFFRNLWLVAYGCATMIVMGDCPYSDQEILAIGAEISLSVCKAYKEVPGLPEGSYDRDAIFCEVLGRSERRSQDENHCSREG